MAVVPFRQPSRQVVLEKDPRPDPKNIRITVDEDGETEIIIGNTAANKKSRPRQSGGFDRNLAEDMGGQELATIASYLLEAIDADDQERSGWVEVVDRAADFLGVKLNDPVTEVAGDGSVSQAVSTCLMEVATKIWGTAHAEQLPVGGPVKVQRNEAAMEPPAGAPVAPGAMGGVGGAAGVAGGLSGGATDDLADALEKDMNWYLTVGDRGYYPDHSKMLMNRNLIGVAFKEIYRDDLEKKPLSRWVMAQDCIVAGSPTHLEAARRYTLRKKISQSRMRRMQKKGSYLDVALVQPTGETTPTEIVVGETEGISPTPTLPRDYDHLVYQCHCELGSMFADTWPGDFSLLEADETGDEPGYPLPYRVDIDKDSRQVIAIFRDWKKGDKDHRRRRRMVKYGFIPAFGDGFYDWGLLQIAGNPTQAATMLQRAGVDASLFANFPAFVMKQGAGSKLEGTVFRPSVGEAVKLAYTGADKIQDILMPIPYKDPSAQSMALQQQLQSEVKSLGGIVEIPVGEGRIGNTPVGTIMSYIESVTMVPGAVHKQDHISQAEEFELLRELLAEEPQCLWRGNRTPARRWQVGQELLSREISPKSDPNTPSQIHRLMKVQGDIVLSGLPQFVGIANTRKIYREAVRVLHGEDAAEYELPEQQPGPAPPDPKMAKVMADMEIARQKEAGKQQEIAATHNAKMQELAITSQDKAADREAANQREMLKMRSQEQKTGADLVSQGIEHAQEERNAAAQRQHEVGIAAQQHQHEAQQAAFSAPLTSEDQGNE